MMNGDSDRARPKQHRSVETKKSLLEAAASLFAGQGYEQTTTHQVASRAGVSVGALYRYFEDKQAILIELYSREVSDLRRRLLKEFSIVDLVGTDVRQLVRKTMASAFKIYGERPHLHRVLNEQSRKIPALSELRRAQEAEIHQAVLQILKAFPGVTLPDMEVGAYLVRLFIESLIDDNIFYRDHHLRFEDQRIIEAASDFIIRYLMGRLEQAPKASTPH